MTPVVCSIPDCKYCSGERCNACTHEPVPGQTCQHDGVLRHQAMPQLDLIAVGRTLTPTLPLEKPMGTRMDIELADPLSFAEFFEALAKRARETGRVAVVIL